MPIEGAEVDFEKIAKIIDKHIPKGTVRDTIKVDFSDSLSRLACQNFDKDKALRSIGTLGEWQFIAIATDVTDRIFLLVYSDARSLAKQVGEFYINSSEYLEGEQMLNYFKDIGILQTYAELNRTVIANTIIDKIGAKRCSSKSIRYNYINIKDMTLHLGDIPEEFGFNILKKYD